MSDKTIFFSYSRQDSDFALNLAKDLRLAGADIWLDQLDIQPGSHWDQSIEEALKSSKTLLVILSKSSVDSKTVMDEVSFALEEDKIVVPVLLEKCEIPFRIRRLQYADFTGNYQDGTKALGQALELDQVIANKFVSAATVTDPNKGEKVAVETVSKTTPPVPTVPKKNPEKEQVTPAKTETIQNTAEIHTRKWNTAIIVLISLVLVAIIGLSIWLIPQFLVDKDSEAWTEANTENSIAAYEDYKDDFPAGKYVEEANDRIVALGLAMGKEREDAAWQNALVKNDAITYNIYIRDFPDGLHVEDARARIEALYNEGQDEDAWKKADEGKTVRDFVGYIDGFAAKGIHHDEAVVAIKELLVKSGYVYYGEKNADNRMKSDRFFDQLEGDKDSPPKVGDLIKVSNPGGVTVRTGPDKSNSSKGTMSVESIAEITKLYPAGDHFWIRIEY